MVFFTWGRTWRREVGVEGIEIKRTTERPFFELQRRGGGCTYLLVFDLQRGEAGLQLLTPLEQLAFQGLLGAHHSHLRARTRTHKHEKTN